MDGTCNAMETCPITTYCYIATIECYILLQRYDMLCHRGASDVPAWAWKPKPAEASREKPGQAGAVCMAS